MAELEDEISALKKTLQDLPPGDERTAVQQQLAALQKQLSVEKEKELLLLQQASGASSTAAGPVTITLVYPGIFKDEDQTVRISFKDDAAYQAFLTKESSAGLLLLEDILTAGEGDDDDDSDPVVGSPASSSSPVTSGGPVSATSSGSIASGGSTTATSGGLAIRSSPGTSSGPATSNGPATNSGLVTISGSSITSGSPATATSSSAASSKGPSVPVVVQDISGLIPNGTYVFSLRRYQDKLDRLVGEAQHLQQAREDEFATAVFGAVKTAFPEQEMERREDLRKLLAENGKEYEQDVVVNGHTLAFVGSHKTYARGAKPVKEIADRVKELGTMSTNPEYRDTNNWELPRQVRAAFMAEKIKPGKEASVAQACRDLGVTRLQRTGNSIRVVASASKGACAFRC